MNSNSLNLKNNAFENINILKIVKEDILRILSEKSKPVSLDILKKKIKVDHPIILKVIEELEKNNVIKNHGNLILLTQLGQENSKPILKKHLVIEDYLKKTRSAINAHVAANIIEHYVSREVINNLKKISTLRKKGRPLTRFNLNKEGIIVEIAFSDYKLFERVVSMGLFPGEKIIVINKVLNRIILKLREKKIALDNNIAERIKAVNYGKF
jgi:Mn-dependent DtxR family transcriptional regulator